MGNDGLNVRIAPRRGGGDTRRFNPAYRRACPFKGGLPAAVLPPPQLRTPLFARHSRDSSLKTELSGVLKGVNFGASRGKARFDIRQLVYATSCIKMIDSPLNFAHVS